MERDWVAGIVLMLGLVVAIVRVTRLLIFDEFPPVRWVRELMINLFGEVDENGNVVPARDDWGRLAGLVYPLAYLWTCPWCMSFWAGLAMWWIADAPYFADLSVPFPWLIIAGASMLSGAWAMIEGEHELRIKRGLRELGRD